MPISPQLAELVASLRAHYDTAILPHWTGNGWNADLLLPYEALDGATGNALPPVRYRAMACARQIYVFSVAGKLDHADTLFGSLQAYFSNGEGGWIYSVDPSGMPLDSTRDLYTHAFVIFACAHYYACGGNEDALAVLQETREVVEQRFADGAGLYQAALSEFFKDKGAGVQQNPIMHLTEAYLAALEATGDAWYAQRLGEIAAAVQDRFVDPASGCVAELPQGTAGNRVEPGHQFEWYSLVEGNRALFKGLPLGASLQRAFVFAQAHGVVPGTLGVSAALDADGSVLDGTQRIWAQTEFARALAVHGTAESLATLEAQLRQYRSRFLHAGGWHECLAPSGDVVRTEMPSTSPYHLATAYAALAELAGRAGS